MYVRNYSFRYYKGNEIPPDDSRLKRTITNGPAADKLTESKVTLKVPKCTKEDTGEYTLKLRNKWGGAECSVSGVAKESPKPSINDDRETAVR